MTAIIQRLDENLIKKISAGEVVERPASVVKELVENSIDAGAKKINIALRAGGKQTIIVADDGVGMSRDDLSMCVHRHATSKMSSASDLFQIHTLGFRGEALASIGAVSHLAIDSRTRDADEGTRLIVEGGIEREMRGIGRAQGTTISVRNLFFNTPARRKFLRHVDTETRHTSQMLVHLAAGYPSIGFELKHEDRQLINFPPTDRKQRAADLLAVPVKGLVDIVYDHEGLSIEGVVAIPEHCNRSRGKQYIIVRGRPIHSRSMVEAVTLGYGGLLPDDRYAIFMLWLEMDPRKIDVNVHPMKREIRLANETHVVAAIEEAVKGGLRLPDSQSFVYEGGGSSFQPAQVGEDTSVSFSAPEVDSSAIHSGPDETGIATKRDLDHSAQMSFSLVAPATLPNGDEGLSDGDIAAVRDRPKLWQMHNQYIVLQIADGLIFIDQQAAHERINYTKAMRQVEALAGECQQLLFPLKLELGSADFAVFVEFRDDFAKLGFIFRDFGERTILIEAIPAELEHWGEGEFIYQLINEARDGRASGRSWREALVLAYVRKSSIKKGQKLSAVEMNRIVEHLPKTPDPHIGPSGKPIMAKIQLSTIDRLFT